ncbi:dihydroxyacetone kinase phosphoryl donor subunit DhaM [Aminiphilus circumscriptus]|uniref:dihydroxyacetone kinase phosphoryl donor subunit DhaM n=1 Tax=Aminiphilus circumscriptus TaxID=290732 RepID=UPI0004926DBD|nr:dihydroxyacetone kinase phosphoryl donor subunit DhaM [Aminiphilus circumscriptus]
MIGILVVSHSAKAAEGIAEIASQMSGGIVPVRAVGGTEEGELGTSVSSIVEALGGLLEEAEGVVLVPDLGSAVLSARSALEFLGDDAKKVLIVDAPILEGAMMASVEASIGSPLERVAQVAGEARLLSKLSR